MLKTNKLIFPTTIIIASIILGGSFYLVQVSKQRSIERQQQIEIEENQKQQEVRGVLQDLEFKQDQCKSLSTGIMKKWDNVVGVSYDEYLGECVVIYIDDKTGEIEESPLRSMKEL